MDSVFSLFVNVRGANVSEHMDLESFSELLGSHVVGVFISLREITREEPLLGSAGRAFVTTLEDILILDSLVVWIFSLHVIVLEQCVDFSIAGPYLLITIVPMSGREKA